MYLARPVFAAEQRNQKREMAREIQMLPEPHLLLQKHQLRRALAREAKRQQMAMTMLR